MAVRETINQIKPAYIVAAAGLCIVVMVVFLYRAIHRSRVSMTQPIVLKCTNCGEVVDTTQEGLNIHHGAIGIADPRYPAMKCPKCGNDSLVLAARCPNDHTVFTIYTYPTDGKPPFFAKCPGGDWDPQEAYKKEQERILLRR